MPETTKYAKKRDCENTRIRNHETTKLRDYETAKLRDYENTRKRIGEKTRIRIDEKRRDETSVADIDTGSAFRSRLKIPSGLRAAAKAAVSVGQTHPYRQIWAGFPALSATFSLTLGNSPVILKRLLRTDRPCVRLHHNRSPRPTACAEAPALS